MIKIMIGKLKFFIEESLTNTISEMTYIFI